LVTGAAGLIGSAVVERFASAGWHVVGVDNDMRRLFFGPAASTDYVASWLMEQNNVVLYDRDIRNEAKMEQFFLEHVFDAVVHCAGQPSHDWAATNPLVDFDVNARGTLVLLEEARRHCPEAPFVFMSTNKVYGDGPNLIPRIERPKRFEYLDCSPLALTPCVDGIPEDFPLDQTMHSLFGCSKLAADQYVQEYGRYFGMKTCALRCGCITGAGHAAVPQHGFLSFLTKCAVADEPYTIFGYDGRQVRDNLWAGDLAALVELIITSPGGAVYNVGGGKANSVSILEAVALIEELTGQKMRLEFNPTPRKGDHAAYYSDLRRVRADYPEWQITKDLRAILAELVDDWRVRLEGAPR